MKTKTYFLKIGSTFVECLFVLVCAFATLIFSVGFFTFKPKSEKDKVPYEVKEAMENLKNNIGWVDMQRKEVKIIAKALSDGIITSADLKKDGDAWIQEQYLRINIREAKVYWSQLQNWGERARSGLSKAQISDAERLAKLIEEQLDMPYKNEEGLTVSKSDLVSVLYRVHHHGSRHHNPDNSALLGISHSP